VRTAKLFVSKIVCAWETSPVGLKMIRRSNATTRAGASARERVTFIEPRVFSVAAQIFLKFSPTVI
jgi:hypothetical protein